MTIRRATLDDAPAIGGIHVEAWRVAYRGLVPNERLAALDPQRSVGMLRRTERDGGETYVAEDEAGIAGFVTVGGCRDDDVDQTTAGEIWGIYLYPSRWRHGLGRSLCRFAERTLAARGCETAVLWVFEENASARRFYEAMGFHPDGAMKTVDVGAQRPCLRYRKPLAVTGE